MRILDRHIGLELVGPFVFGVAAFTSFFFAGQNLLNLTKQVLAGTPVLTVVEIITLSLPSMVVFTLPMAALVAVLVAFSRLSSESEIVALYACGVSVYRAMIPVLVLGLAVTALGFLMTEYVVPPSNRLSKAIQAHIVKEELSTSKPFVIVDPDTNSTIYVSGGYDAKTRTMRDVTISRFRGKDLWMIYQAKRAVWAGAVPGAEDAQKNIWKLYDGKYTTWVKSAVPGTPDSVVDASFAGLSTQPIELNETPKDIAFSRISPEDMTYGDLKARIARLKLGGVKPEDLQQLEVQMYEKLAIPFAALIFALIGAPLAVRPARASTSLGVGLSVLIIFAYWFVWHFTAALANQGSLPPAVGAFAADVLGLALGVILLLRTAK